MNLAHETQALKQYVYFFSLQETSSTFNPPVAPTSEPLGASTFELIAASTSEPPVASTSITPAAATFKPPANMPNSRGISQLSEEYVHLKIIFEWQYSAETIYYCHYGLI